jgi:hypothetical protein
MGSGATALRIPHGGLAGAAWLGVAVAAICCPARARADLATYPDFSSWRDAVSGVVAISIPDPDPAPFTFLGTGTASVTYGDVTFSTDGSISDGSFYNIGMLFSGSPAVLSSQGASTGPENIRITFAAPVYGVALNYGTFEGGDVVFLLSNGDSFTQGSTGGGGYAVPDFAGATDFANPFDSVLITTAASVLDINSISYTRTVPAPAGFTLLAIGGAALILGPRRHRRA